MGNRSDKKDQTRPFVSEFVRAVVQDIRGFKSSRSEDEVARKVVLAAFGEWSIVEQLAPYLRWDFPRGDRVFIGHVDHDDITRLLPDQWSRVERLSIRFTQDDVRQLELLCSCLSCPWAHMVGALLRLGVDSSAVIERVAPGYKFQSAYSLRRGVFK